jgi:predicted nucleic acid-binding protein
VIYDTNFLIALQSRNKRFTRAAAEAWITQNQTGPLYLPRLVAIEFQSGMPDDAAATPFLCLFTILPMDEAVLFEAVIVMRELRRSGQSIGAADSIIAATARLYGLPLVTDNVRHFKRVTGLEVRGYIK